MKATQYLIQEHKLILRALDVLDAIGTSVEKTQTANQPDVEKILDFLRWFADAHHQAKEESIFFPALTHAAASQGRSVEHLTLEHNQERALIEDLEKNVRLVKLAEFVSTAHKLTAALRNHIFKEDRILFEEADAVFSVSEDQIVFDRLSGFDTARDKQVLDEKLRDLRALEWTYLRK